MYPSVTASRNDFVLSLAERVRGLGPFGDAPATQRAVSRTLNVLVESLPVDQVHRLHRALGVRLAEDLGDHQPLIDSEDGLASRLAEVLQEAPGKALEQAQLVCHALLAALPGRIRQRFMERVPPHLRIVFRGAPATRGLPDYEAPLGAHSRAKPLGTGHTLADGRPGSRTPLSEAYPVHSESVVLSDNPHGDRKLSSSPGPEDRLSTARPDSAHPVSEAEP